MLRPTRSLLAQVSVVLAIVSLTSVALAPRGMLRAVAADALDHASSPVDDAIDAPADIVDLPGVRALVSKEEQDPHEALLDVLGTAPAVRADLVAPEVRVAAPADRPPAPATASSTNDDRAPPSSI